MIAARTASKKAVAAIVAAAILVGLITAQRALARIAMNTIDPAGAISDNGRLVVLTGPIQCTQSEWIDLRVTVTQRARGAVAEGHLRVLGSTAVQQWVIAAPTQGGASFEAGPATAVALMATSLNGQVTDAHQWLVEVILTD